MPIPIPESSPGAPDLDARLVEIDRKLREIQAELAPDREPASAPTAERPRRGRDGPLATLLERTPPNPPAPPDSDRLATQIQELTELNANLLSSMIEVLAGFQRALAQMQRREGELSVSAGPFASLEAVRAFGRQLAGIPGVSAVEVRGYEGEDRALIDVRLSTSTT